MANTKTGWSERVRQVAEKEYVLPARMGKMRIRIPFGDLKTKMVELGFPQGNANQIASPLESSKFWRPLGLEMCSPKGQSRSVDTVLEFKFIDEPKSVQSVDETETERVLRLAEKLRGLMKDKIAEHGGTEGYIRWVRSDEDSE